MLAYGPGNLMPMHTPCPAEFIRSEGRFTGLTSRRFVLYSLQEREVEEQKCRVIV